jgi:hypothetical protein
VEVSVAANVPEAVIEVVCVTEDVNDSLSEPLKDLVRVVVGLTERLAVGLGVMVTLGE